MRRSKVEVGMHVAWATKGREPLLTPDIERDVYRCIENEAKRAGCTVFAVNGMPDHVHLLIHFSATVSIAELLKRVKGVSSAMVNDLNNHKTLFRWQEGYCARGVSHTNIPRVIAYVENQKRHHASGKLVAELEETDEEVEDTE
ncbi:MAG TPA: IS200/IS605 family transposase [Chthonomonadaceae bacterium]|nr:IS200/IS605 family transposase [Chthonomonadaceae bacterium]